MADLGAFLSRVAAPGEPAAHRRSSSVPAAFLADLDLPHAEPELLKARLTLQIYRIIKARNLTQAKAGEILGIRQPHVFAPIRNRAGMFSLERLMEFLTDLGQDVEIVGSPGNPVAFAAGTWSSPSRGASAHSRFASNGAPTYASRAWVGPAVGFLSQTFARPRGTTTGTRGRLPTGHARSVLDVFGAHGC